VGIDSVNMRVRSLLDVDALMRWRYYFLDLPKWAYGVGLPPLRKNLFRLFDSEIWSIREGIVTLWDFCGKATNDADINAAVDKALGVKLLRESDCYNSLRMTKKNLHKYFHLEGMENLHASIQTGRPIVLLTGHIGSFVVPLIALSKLGFRVYPIAGNVTHPVAATRSFISFYHALIKRQLPTSYIYTDLKGKIDRSIIPILNANGMLWVALDLPKNLSPAARIPVTFLGHTSSLPAGLIQWGLKKNVLFLTAWNTVETEDNVHFMRRLRIGEPIDSGLDAQGILQTYADRLSELLCREPWQWMQLDIVKEFDKEDLPDKKTQCIAK
jgi:lauroyl/myristoyl acyltransferase